MFKFNPDDYVVVTLFGLNFEGRVNRCVGRRIEGVETLMCAKDTTFESTLVYHTATSDATSIIQEAIDKLRYVY